MNFQQKIKYMGFGDDIYVNVHIHTSCCKYSLFLGQGSDYGVVHSQSY